MSNLELIRETSSRIPKGLFPEKSDPAIIESLDNLKHILSQKILILMQEDLQALLNILYRIDIDEKKLKLAFKNISDEDIANEIALLVITREMQKVELRRKYSKGN